MRLLVLMLVTVALVAPSVAAVGPRTVSEPYFLTYPYYQIPHDFLGAVPSGPTCGYNIGGACFEVNDGERRVDVIVDDVLGAPTFTRVFAITSDGVAHLRSVGCNGGGGDFPADTVRIEVYVFTVGCALLNPVRPTTGTITAHFSSEEAS